MSTRWKLTAAGSVICLLCAVPAVTAPVMVTERAVLGGSVFVDWAQLGPPLTVISPPIVAAASNGSAMATVRNSSGDLERRDQGDGWFGNFADGDALLWTMFNNGPLALTFDQPVLGAGVQIQRQLFGAFTAHLRVFDPADRLIATFDLAGDSNDAGDGSAIFLGVLDDAPTISRIEYEVDKQSADFSVNQLDLLTFDIFADGFESGDTSSWPLAVGLSGE